MSYISYYNSPLGRITLAGDGTALTGLWFEGQRYYGATLSGETEEKYLPVFRQTERWLDIYFSGREPEFIPDLRIETSAFRRLVYEQLLEIPYGRTLSYGELAVRIAEIMGREKMSARAVGAAVGRNPVSLIIPCHRVLGAKGRLTGYAGGLDRKLRLLRLENGCTD